jgi:hypothetical protein
MRKREVCVGGVFNSFLISLLCLSIFLCFIFLFSIPIISADAVHDEMQRITSYAQEYEIGNINYVELTLYLSASRERLNQALGATDREKGGILMDSQLRQILGEPTERARWVWVQNEQREERVSEEVPAWKKIVFDGKKVQIWLNAWPTIFIRGDEKLLYYNLNTEIRFKKPGEQMNILAKIDEIKSLAETYNKNPSVENAEALAEKSGDDVRSLINSGFMMMIRQGGNDNEKNTEVNEEDIMEGDKDNKNNKDILK